jgi:hypothetical protein
MWGDLGPTKMKSQAALHKMKGHMTLHLNEAGHLI